MFAWQIGRINSAELPELRAVEALGIVIALFLVLFSAIYLSLSHGDKFTFTQDLDHAKALYFTITIFSTVGFGDITPQTDAARLIVSAEMLLDLAIIGVVVRLLLNVAKSRIARHRRAGRRRPPRRPSSRTRIAVGPWTVVPLEARRRRLHAAPLMCMRDPLCARFLRRADASPRP